ncbi:DALR anticodon-binding domain-containing protein [Streptomyces sp. NPDC051320]|uniref:DALR anticodon-binding domain-containing protein n=1 Tax=Streptomyces sp. NPDC051320 TaxID=3154644 RepID=UPI003449739C
MTPAELSCTVARAVRRAVDEGALRVAVPERVTVERPRPGGRGDYATNAALRLAGPAGMPPRVVAEALRQRIAGMRGIERVEITGPGFLNFTLVPEGAGAVVRAVLGQSARYGRGTAPGGPAWQAPVLAPAHVARLGADAARWDALLGGGEQLLVRREGNPLFRVQYAYARSRALLRNADDLGFRAAYEHGIEQEAAVPALVAALADHPAFVEAVEVEAVEEADEAPRADSGAARRLARHLVTVADAFLEFHVTVLPVGDEKPSAAHRSRLALAEAAGTVLAGGLALLGICAPEHI